MKSMIFFSAQAVPALKMEHVRSYQEIQSNVPGIRRTPTLRTREDEHRAKQNDLLYAFTHARKACNNEEELDVLYQQALKLDMPIDDITALLKRVIEQTFYPAGNAFYCTSNRVYNPDWSSVQFLFGDLIARARRGLLFPLQAVKMLEEKGMTNHLIELIHPIDQDPFFINPHFRKWITPASALQEIKNVREYVDEIWEESRMDNRRPADTLYENNMEQDEIDRQNINAILARVEQSYTLLAAELEGQQKRGRRTKRAKDGVDCGRCLVQ